MTLNSFKKIKDKLKREEKELDRLMDILNSAEGKFSKQSEKVYRLKEELEYWENVTK